MIDFVEKLRNRPEHERRVIAISVSLGVTLVIFIAWASIFFSSVGADSVTVTREDIEARQKILSEESLSPIESLRESAASVGESVRSLRELFDKANSVKYNQQ